MDTCRIELDAVDELNDASVKSMVNNTRLHTIQIQDKLTDDAFSYLNCIFEQRADIAFRIYGDYGGECKIDFLKKIPNVKNIRIEHNGVIDLSVLAELKFLESLHISVIDLRDYSFLKQVGRGIKDLSLYMDVKSGSHNFDCEWLLAFDHIESLYLGKAKKNITAIADMQHIKNLVLRGSKIADYSFLAKCPLQKLAIHWCGAAGLDTLAGVTNLRQLELWRINGLDNLNFISKLTGLRYIGLQDLARVSCLPDLSALSGLEEISIDNMKNLKDISVLCKIMYLKNIKMFRTPGLKLNEGAYLREKNIFKYGY